MTDAASATSLGSPACIHEPCGVGSTTPTWTPQLSSSALTESWIVGT